MWAPALLAVLSLGTISLGVGATPLRPSFTSCIGSYSAASADSQLVVSDVWANLVSGEEAKKLNLTGEGHDVLRVDLLGTAKEEISGYDNSTNKLLTLFHGTTAAHISVYQSTSWLCDSVFPSTLPSTYFPHNTTYCPITAGDFGINISIPLYRSYALTTLRTQVRVVDTSSDALTLACYDLDFTPYYHGGWYYKLFLWLPVAIAISFWILTWAARFAAGWVVGSGVAEYGTKEGGRVEGKREARMRAWGTMIISGLSGERLGASSALLRFVTPGLRDIFFQIQFATMLGMIAVRWPRFTYPIVSQLAWADLVWNVTLVQGSNPMSKRFSDLPNNYTVPSAFASQITDPHYPLYLDSSSYNPLLDLYGSKNGMESFATAVGLRRQDLFGTCLVVVLCITAAITLLSLLLWLVHALYELFSPDTRRTATRSGAFSHSPQPSLGGKEAFEPRSSAWDSDGSVQAPRIPRRATATASAPSNARRTFLRFRPRGEAGAFHLAALFGNLVRLIIIFHLPITAFSIYQLTLSNASIVSRVFAALAFAFISVLIPAFLLFKISRTPSGKLHDATRTLLSLGPMYNVYVEERQMFRAYIFGASLIEGIVVGAGQKSGLAQAIIFVVVELFMLVFPVVWYPWGEGASMGAPSAFISVLRVASTLMAMLLATELGMGRSTRDWIAYAALILQAIVFVFFVLMLLVKLVEGLIRLFGGAHFDESKSPLDGGLFAAIMDLDCLNGVGGGKAAERKRRKHGSRQLQRNVSAAGSLTTQMMLDRHSQGVLRDDAGNPLVSPYGQATFAPNAPPGIVGAGGYFAPRPQQPPLGPPPQNERYSSDSRSEPSASGHIMDAWRPVQSSNAYALAPQVSPPPDASSSGNGPSRSFSVIRGGRADFEHPYDVKPNSGPGRTLPPPPPVQQRQSYGAAGYGSSSTAPGAPVVYPTGNDAQGLRANNQGLRPPSLAIPKRRSLNDIKDEESPESKKGKGKRRVSGWARKDAKSPRGEDDDSDSELELGAMRGKLPKPFEPVPIVYPDTDDEGQGSKSKKGWKPSLFGRRKKEEDEFASLARDENKARKAALATESGSLLAGVDTPPQAPGSSFSVKRRGFGTPTKASNLPPSQGEIAAASAATSTPPASQQQQQRSFAVKRMGQRTPEPVLVPVAPAARSTIPKSTPPNVPATARPSTETTASMSPTAAAALRQQQQQQAVASGSGSGPGSGPGSGSGVAGGGGAAVSSPVRSFKVLNRPGMSNPTSPTSPGSSETSPRPSFVVNRLKSYEYRQAATNDTEELASPDESVPLESAGYPSTSFVPFDQATHSTPLDDARAQAFGTPLRPVKSPRRSVESQRLGRAL